MFKKTPIHYPNLKTVIMIESFISKQKKPVSKNHILSNVPKKIMRQSLNTILKYLEVSGKVYVGSKGVEWVFDDNKKFKTELRRAAEDFIK